MIERPDTHYATASDGVRIAYQTFGVGRYDLLFVPGQLSHLDLQWEEPLYARWLARLGQLGRVVIMDRRGVGLSDRLSPRDLPPAEVLAEDLGAVLEGAGASQPVLFGWAEGGQIGSLFAATHPERIAGLILYGTPTHVPEEELRTWERWLDWAPGRWGSFESAMNDLRELSPSRSGDAALADWVRRVQRSALSPSAVRPLFEISIALDVRDVLPAITVPTLVMRRERDSAQPTALLDGVAASIPDARHVVLPGTDHWIVEEPQGPMFDAIEAFLGELGGLRPEPTRRLATVLFTDIVASTERSAELGDAAWTRALERHRADVRKAFAHHGGRELGTAGDGFLASFQAPAEAARCALWIARDAEELGMPIRAGVHTGEVQLIDGEIGGLGVTIGARVAALAGASEVLVTSTVRDLTAGSGLTFIEAGEHELKGVPDRWRLYRVVG
jgi:class 3 adenylate cyclase/pimeloyl-ACP methyl ester carboxylesterase